MTRPRRAFTLVEVVVALAITGLVALATHAALQAGVQTRDAIEGPLRDAEAALLARAMLGDALRHAADGDTRESFARPASTDGDELRFVSRGVAPPLGGARLWDVRVAPRGGALVVTAAPVDGGGPLLRTAVPGVRGVRVASLGADRWRDDARALALLPSVVRVEFLGEPGAAPLAPLVVRTPVGGWR